MKNNVPVILLIILSLTFINGGLHAEDEILNEDELFSQEESMFSGEDMIIEQDEVVSENIDQELNQQGLGASYQVIAGTTYNIYEPTDWFGQDNEDEYNSNILAGIFIDARFGNGNKSFLNLEANYNCDDNNIDYTTREFFVDANWKNKVYVRTGKQILKWGRSYFWNPTDLINIEKKDFLNMDKEREGTNGIKLHIPQGVEKNIYLFLGLDDFQDIKKEELSLAAKYELLYGNTEMALSVWDKENYKPVFGFDISGRISDVDLRGEVSLSREYYTLDYDTLSFVNHKKEWIPKISIGFTKSFGYGDISDRISLTGELYYNHAGYEKNILTRIQEVADVNQRLDIKSRYLHEVYAPYRNSKYYLAVFSSVDKFIISDMTFNLNGLTNLVDNSATLTTGLRYNPKSNLYIDFNIIKYVGDNYTEATFMGNNISYELKATMSF